MPPRLRDCYRRVTRNARARGWGGMLEMHILKVFYFSIKIISMIIIIINNIKVADLV